ncbi:MAG: hypothetical protein ACI4I3_04565 [Acutalibacteraceae bacterium]
MKIFVAPQKLIINSLRRYAPAFSAPASVGASEHTLRGCHRQPAPSRGSPVRKLHFSEKTAEIIGNTVGANCVRLLSAFHAESVEK